MANAIFSNLGAFLMAIIMTLVPTAGFSAPVMQTKNDNCSLNLVLVSDVHLEANGIFRQSFLKAALRRANNAKSKVDGIVCAGDITNYADEPALASYYDIITNYTDLPVVTAAGNHDIGHAGDRDVTDISREEAMANVIRYQNAYAGTQNEHNYYATEINGYKFIVLGDECIDGGHWDAMDMSDEQLAFLDEQLAEGTREGKPCFVVSHWPADGKTSENIVWPDSACDYDIASIMEKYPNVIYISGHMHSGVKSTYMDKKYGITSAEKVNGVIYLSLPTLGVVNTFGLTGPGRGATLEIYEDSVVFRPINYLTGNWYENAEYTFDLTQNIVR